MQRNLSATFDLVELHKVQIIHFFFPPLREFLIAQKMHIAPGVRSHPQLCPPLSFALLGPAAAWLFALLLIP